MVIIDTGRHTVDYLLCGEDNMLMHTQTKQEAYPQVRWSGRLKRPRGVSRGWKHVTSVM